MNARPGQLKRPFWFALALIACLQAPPGTALMNGTSPTITRNGYHVAVKTGDIIRDAYTGPAGMRLTDYVLRLHARRGIDWNVVDTP